METLLQILETVVVTTSTILAAIGLIWTLWRVGSFIAFPIFRFAYGPTPSTGLRTDARDASCSRSGGFVTIILFYVLFMWGLDHTGGFPHSALADEQHHLIIFWIFKVAAIAAVEGFGVLALLSGLVKAFGLDGNARVEPAVETRQNRAHIT